MKTINWYLKNGQLAKDEEIKKLHEKFLEKAKQSSIVMNILFDLSNNEKGKKLLKIRGNPNFYEWVVICGYYAMYTSALALLAKIGYKSKNHTATLLVLEEVFVKKRLLDKESFLSLKNAMFQKEEIEKLSDARHKREIAQYSITKQTTKDIAEKIKNDAYDFIDKCEEIISS